MKVLDGLGLREIYMFFFVSEHPKSPFDEAVCMIDTCAGFYGVKHASSGFMAILL